MNTSLQQQGGDSKARSSSEMAYTLWLRTWYKHWLSYKQHYRFVFLIGIQLISNM